MMITLYSAVLVDHNIDTSVAVDTVVKILTCDEKKSKVMN